MSFIFALFQKVSDLFASPHLPLDSTLFGIKLTD
jgi:hypothetical protein